MPHPHARAWSPIWAGAIFFAISIGFIGVYPIVSGDEIIGNDPANEWVSHGVFRSSLFADLPGFGHGYYLQPPGQFFTGVAAYELMGFGLWQTRVAALLWGAGAVASFGALAQAWCGSRRAGWIAALLLMFNPQFDETIAQARMDGQALCLLALGCLLFARAQAGAGSDRGGARRSWLFGGAGLLVGLAGITHPVSAFWAVGLGLAMLDGARGRRRAALADLVLFGIAAAMPAALWFAAGTAHPHEFQSQFLSHGRSKLSGFDPWGQVRREVARWVAKSYAHTPLLLIAFAGGALWWLRASSIDRLMRRTGIWLTLVVAAATAFILNKDSGPFNLYPAALLTVMAAGWLDRCLSRTSEKTTPARVLVSFAVVLLAASLAVKFALPRLVAATVQRRARDYGVVTAAVRRHVRSGALVCGYPASWYAVEEAGGSLRLGVSPDVRKYDFVICAPGDTMRAPAGYVLLEEFGTPMPLFMGRDFSAGTDYNMLIYGKPPRSRP